MSSFWSQRGHCLRLQRDRVFNLGKWSALLGSHSCGLSWDPITLPCPCFSTCEESTVSLQIHLLVTLCFLCLQNLCSWRFPTETDRSHSVIYVNGFFFSLYETIEIESESLANHSFLQCPVAMGYGGSGMELHLKCL